MSRETRTATWTIDRAAQNITLSPQIVNMNVGGTEGVSVTYLGDGTLSAESASTSIATVSVSGNTVTVAGAAAGSTTVTVRVAQGTNYLAGSETLTVAVAQGVVLPTQSGTLTYNKSEQEPSWNNYNSSQLQIGGVTAGTNADTYTATFTPKQGFAWADTGTTEARDAQWTIDTAKVSLPTQSGTLTYDGTEQEPTWTTYDPDAFTVSGTQAATNAGDYDATFTPNAPNYEWAT